MLNPNIHKIKLTKKEFQIYNKQLIVPQIGINGQKRLKKAKILVIGAGGLGCPCMTYLISAGIGYIGIIDYDNISISNLNRQILYDINHIKTSKIAYAKKKLSLINPYCKIILHPYKLNNLNAFEIIQYYDIIIDATDNFKARYDIDNYCYLLHKIHVYSAVQQFESQISIFNYRNNIRYSNLYKKDINLIDNSCNRYGILGIITGSAGILQATESIKIIMGIGKVMHNYLFIQNLLNISVKKRIKSYITKQYYSDSYNNNKILNFNSLTQLKQNNYII
uniref:Molybdopterin biosynthesis protein n=1 Tax=Halydictyon mirabile TaxID=189652 RepID=A0A4D6WX01_9FLOR|nr:Molybdopterin biosynthesis protein [Halydictyon mirabile]